MGDSLYTWGGTYFGKRKGDSLFTLHGIEAGRFRGDEIFGADGKYLGELRNGKLIRKSSKASSSAGSFSPRRHVGHIGYVHHVGTVMLAGYEDFPAPETFR